MGNSPRLWAFLSAFVISIANYKLLSCYIVCSQKSLEDEANSLCIWTTTKEN